jgi:diguanylate cyclase (GGDEF)-like protein
MIRLLICDDSESFRTVLRITLAEQAEISVVGEAGDGQEAVDLALALSPDVVLMDVRMPLLDGVEATRQITAALPSVRVIALTGSDDRAVVSAMLEAGATAYCVKGAPLGELERAVAGAAEPLVRVAHTLNRAANARGAAELAAREVVELTGGAGVAVYLAAPDVGLSLASAAGPAAGVGVTAAPGIALDCFRGQQLVQAGSKHLAELAAVGLPGDEAVAAPLLDGTDIVGVLLAVKPPAVGLELDHGLVAAVADLAAAAVANQRRVALTHDEARRDALTGLPNRRAFEERLDELLTDPEREPFGLVLLDLDDFKRVNDAHGHAAGDDVLREVARIATRAFRTTEEAYRLGGDELAIVVPGGRLAAKLVAGRVRAGLRRHRRGLRLPPASGGIAAFPADAETRGRLLEIADLALRSAKAAGGDRISSAGNPLQALPQAQEVAPASAASTRPSRGRPRPRLGRQRPIRVLVVDDDERLRILLRTTLEVIDIEIDEAAGVPAARTRITADRPDVVVLDLGLPGQSGLSLCEELKRDPRTRDIGIVVLTGSDEGTGPAARAAGADGYLRKPFSPLDLLSVVEQLAGGLFEGPFQVCDSRPPEEQLIRYAEDLKRLLELEQGQRALIQAAYCETVGALTSALEAKDLDTNAHSHRVQRYAMELTWTVEPRLVEEPSVEYGFLLHDVGKIGIPDRILSKPGPLTKAERRVLETHVILGEQMLSGVALLHGGGLEVVRHHHERWDGDGYPDGLSAYDIPLPARIFSVADALDAMTSDRPYRPALPWDEAVVELLAQSGKQFDPHVVDALLEREPRLRLIHGEFAGDVPQRLLAVPDEEHGRPGG